MKRRIIATLLVGAMAVSSLMGCSVPDTSPEQAATEAAEGETAAEGDTAAETESAEGEMKLTYALQADAPTLDPQKMNSMPSATVGYHIFDGLYRNEEGNIIPAAAESYEMSEDGLTYTFKLREGLVWSDGQPIVAGDFVYGMQRLMDPATASDYAFIGEVLKNGLEVETGKVEVSELGVSAPDDQTVVIELAYPATYFLSMLSMSQFTPCRKDMVEQYGQDFAATAESNVYSGPFMVSEVKPNDRLILKKNPNYWDAEHVYLDTVELITVADANTQLAMYESGELDFVDLSVDMVASYEGQTEPRYDGSNDYIIMNQLNEFLSNKNLRLAFNYALNRDEYIQLATANVFEANTRFVLPQVKGAEEDYGTEYPYEAYPASGDADKAKEYLATAMSELGVENPSDIVLELAVADSETAKRQAEVVQAQLQDTLGVVINVKQLPYAQRIENENKKEYDMSLAGWVPDYSDPYTYLGLWITDGSYNQTSYSNPEYDALLEQATTELDPKARMDLLFQAEQIFCEDGVVIPLQLRQVHMLKSEAVEDLQTYFVGTTYDFIHAKVNK